MVCIWGNLHYSCTNLKCFCKLPHAWLNQADPASHWGLNLEWFLLCACCVPMMGVPTPVPRGWSFQEKVQDFSEKGCGEFFMFFSDLDKVVVWKDSEGLLREAFNEGADPIYPTLNSLQADTKSQTKAKDRFLISLSPFNWWVPRYNSIMFQIDLKNEINLAMKTVEENFSFISDLYPLRLEISQNFPLAKLVDALITLGNLRLWWETPPNSRVAFDRNKLCARVFTDVKSLELSPSKEFFDSQLQALANPKKEFNPFKRNQKGSSRGRGRGKQFGGRGYGRGGGRRGRGQRGNSQKGRGAVICYNCREQGHMAKNCPHPPRPKAPAKDGKGKE